MKLLALGAGAALLAAACDQGHADPLAGNPAGFEALAAAYRSAHAAHDAEGVLALVHQPKGGTGTATLRSVLAVDMQSRVGAITLEPINPGERLEYTIRGVTYRPSATPVGRMKVTLATPATVAKHVTTTETSYLVGIVDGRYRILGDRAVPR